MAEKINQSLSVDSETAGLRLDACLAEQMPEISRSRWQKMIDDGLVKVNGSSYRANRKLRIGDVVTWDVPEDKPEEMVPEQISLSILHEDDAILVLNKPPGLVVHPAAGNETGTLVNALLHHDPVFRTLERSGIVHRLDKDTSGVLVVAKSQVAMTELQRQFKSRETEKEYLALVWGRLPDQGRIVTWIGRHPVHRQKMAVLETAGREAVSNYETLERFSEVSLVRIRIETGRTHQIRVHMAHLGHPVLGDRVYGRGRRSNSLPRPERQMLHAYRLGFTHPASRKWLSFEAPMFEDMRQMLESLRM